MPLGSTTAVEEKRVEPIPVVMKSGALLTILGIHSMFANSEKLHRPIWVGSGRAVGSRRKAPKNRGGREGIGGGKGTGKRGVSNNYESTVCCEENSIRCAKGAQDVRAVRPWKRLAEE